MVQMRRGDVVAGSLQLLEVTGIGALTTRKLAAHLGLQAGSLYWHFPSKQALVEAMADQIMAGIGAPSRGGTWDELLAEFARRIRAALLAHRDGARIVAGSYVTEPNTVRVSGAWVQALHDRGLRLREAVWASATIANFVLGHVIEEQGMADLSSEQLTGKSLTALSYPDQPDDVNSAIVEMMLVDPDERFEFGLGLYLDGLRQRASGDAAPTEALTPTPWKAD